MKRNARRLLAAMASTTALVGCLGEPEIEDRWTRLDIQETNLSPGQSLAPGTTTINVAADVTFRSVITGVVVAELRVASGVPISSTVLDDPDAPPEAIAADVDRILANSVTAGRATRAITGWDHLIFPVDLTFDATVPDTLSAGGGLFLVTYLGDGEEIELEDGSDSLVVTPFISSETEILHTGYELRVDGGTAP
jgi:hypothetical protein